ncbi:MAG: hypothetical protein ACJAWV_002611 [Flammeovirgaceae bacterium]|jgi:hypothetical protein
MKAKQILGSTIAILALFFFGFAQVNGASINQNGKDAETKDTPKKFAGNIKADLKAANGIIVEFKHATESTKLVVKDLSGRKVFTYKFGEEPNTVQSIDLSSLKVGMYNITLTSGNNVATGVYTVINE